MDKFEIEIAATMKQNPTGSDLPLWLNVGEYVTESDVVDFLALSVPQELGWDHSQIHAHTFGTLQIRSRGDLRQVVFDHPSMWPPFDHLLPGSDEYRYYRAAEWLRIESDAQRAHAQLEVVPGSIFSEGYDTRHDPLPPAPTVPPKHMIADRFDIGGSGIPTWFVVGEEVTEDELAEYVVTKMPDGLLYTPEEVKIRLFGGVKTNFDLHHIRHNEQGYPPYADGDLIPGSREAAAFRRHRWIEMFQVNHVDGIELPGTIFTYDAPTRKRG